MILRVQELHFETNSVEHEHLWVVSIYSQEHEITADTFQESANIIQIQNQAQRKGINSRSFKKFRFWRPRVCRRKRTEEFPERRVWILDEWCPWHTSWKRILAHVSQRLMIYLGKKIYIQGRMGALPGKRCSLGVPRSSFKGTTVRVGCRKLRRTDISLVMTGG